jgi:hypothetical protein
MWAFLENLQERVLGGRCLLSEAPDPPPPPRYTLYDYIALYLFTGVG